MKYIKRIRGRFALAAVVALGATFSYAQDESEDVFELSPFTVDASGDEGYRATSTTAGSRLNTQLKDIAASVTVLTNEFMDDLGATDIASALSMVSGVETDLTTDTTQPHLGQGFIGNDFGDQNTFDGRVRIRGLGTATQSANYLEVLGPIDRYNMERTEFLRGPNALLFGLGQPGGVVNYSTKKAHLNKDINKFDIVLDNFGTHRVVGDVSRVLLEDKLAFRAVTMYSDQRYMYKTAENRDKRIHLATTYKPFENTKIDAYYEKIKTDGRRPNYRVPQDNVSDWLREYNRAHETYSGQELDDYLNRNLVWDASWSTTSNGRAPGSPDIILNELLRTNPDGSPVTFAGDFRRPNDGRDRGAYGYYTSDDWNTPINGQLTYSGTVTVTGGNATNSPRSRLQFHRSAYPHDRRNTSFLDPQILTEDMFPIFDYSLDTLPGSFRTVDDEKYSFGIEQKINEDFYVSLSFLREDYTSNQLYAPLAQTQAISLDINKYLPGSLDNAGAFTGSRRNGLTLDEAVAEAQLLVADPETSAEDVASNQLFLQSVANREPNPNYLRPYFHGRSIGGFNDFSTESFLGQANYDFDFAKKTDGLAWLGKHRLTGFASQNTKKTWGYRYTGTVEYQDGVIGNDSSPTPARRQFWPLWYIGDAVQPGDTGLNITGLPTDTTPHENEDVGFYYFDNSDSSRGRWVSGPQVKWRQHVIDRTASNTEIDGDAWGGSLQSFFWNGRVVATYGYREDTVQNLNFFRVDDTRGSALNNPIWQAGRQDRGLGIERDDIIVTDIEGDGSSLEDYFLDRPQDLFKSTVGLETKSLVFHVTPWLRVFGNQSENFALTAPASDGFGRTIPPQGGTTDEYGFGMTLLDSKLDVTMNFYETKQIYEPIGNLRLSSRLPGFEDRVFNTFARLDQRRSNGRQTEYDIGDWRQVVGIDADGNAITEASGVREPQLDPEGMQIFDDDGNPQWDYDGDWDVVSNPGVTQDSVSEGWEINATYNPNRNLRFMGSLSKLENTRQNAEREVIDYIRARADYWDPLFNAGYHTNGDNDATVYIDPATVADDYVLQGTEQFGEPEPNESLLIDDFYDTLGAELINIIRANGTSNIGISEYNARGTANYSFHEGLLKGFSFGANLRWESGKVLGYPVVARGDDFLPEGFPITDINGNGQVDEDEFAIFTDDTTNPYESGELVTGGLMVSYRTKLMNDKVNWRVQLNANNLFKQGDDFRIIRRDPDGGAIYGVNVPATFRLTNSFEF